MNIVHAGDHVIIVYPICWEDQEQANRSIGSIKELANLPDDVIKHVSMTWMPIGPKGSEPYVLFATRYP